MNFQQSHPKQVVFLKKNLEVWKFGNIFGTNDRKMKKRLPKNYKNPNPPLNVAEEPAVALTSYYPARYYGSSEMDILKVIKKGVSKKTLDQTLQMMGFSLEDMAGLLHISERTLRRYDDSTTLNAEQSERIVELNNLYHYGAEVFGALALFKKWVNSPVLALGNKKPREFLDTSLGISILQNILGKIEYGVYS